MIPIEWRRRIKLSRIMRGDDFTDGMSAVHTLRGGGNVALCSLKNKVNGERLGVQGKKR